MRKAVNLCVNCCYLKNVFCPILICTSGRDSHLGGGTRVAVVIFE